MLRFPVLVTVIVALYVSPAAAQSHQPYAGLQERALKALSEQQIADLRAGRGSGLALAAELNGYPGPVHVLEHAAALKLTPEQRQRTQALYDAMKVEAVPLGDRLIAQEAALDRAFSRKTVTPQSLAQAAAAIGQTQGELRAAHLRYHLAQIALLTPDQVRRYGELRGYGEHGSHKSGNSAPHDHGHRGR
ncbi:MAG: Spy/CpxP family protein refolding chaperone [Variibacter sp.]